MPALKHIPSKMCVFFFKKKHVILFFLIMKKIQVKIVCKIKYILIFMISKYRITFPVKTFFSLFLIQL